MAAPLYTTASGQLYHAGRILIATVGLPARGKTHLSHALERYLRWLGVTCACHSLGDYRRKVLGGAEKLPPDYFSQAPRSAETEKLRKKILEDFDELVVDFLLNKGGQVVIYDANNGTVARRQAIREKFGALGINVLFLESICTDQSIVEANIRSVKISSPDYRSWDSEKAVIDFKRRIAGNEKNYEAIEQPSFPYIKIVNVGQQIVVNNIQGYLQSRVVFFLMNIHNRARTIYLAKAGEALIEHLYKADADLSSLGWEYADGLCDFVEQLRHDAGELSVRKAKEGTYTGREQPGYGPGEDGRPLEVWTSARKRSKHTATPFGEKGYRTLQRSQLAERNPGVVDGLSVEEIRKRFPDEWGKELKEPYSFRFPRAESYHDLSVRLEPIIFELERATNDVLIICQSSVMRCLMSYLQGHKPQDIASVEVDDGTLYEFSPQAYGVSVREHRWWDAPRKRRERDEAYERQRKLQALDMGAPPTTADDGDTTAVASSSSSSPPPPPSGVSKAKDGTDEAEVQKHLGRIGLSERDIEGGAQPQRP